MNKDRVFTAADAPRGVRRKGQDYIEAWAEEQTERWKVVAYDPDTDVEERKPIVAEELNGRTLSKCSDKGRRVVGMLLRFDEADRKQAVKDVLKVFDSDGNITYPFDFID